jgi:hypothetical protein
VIDRKTNPTLAVTRSLRPRNEAGRRSRGDGRAGDSGRIN